ncbi:autoinducer 2 ABC transporter substrate-binding protein [Shewanella sp. D64]|uniref:autoinducer 2 ABC transporter substrate-binding protein n=1 Tax=unclassified Shewanella TaxID=196818 RepID=UPI0022BA5C82|nr:MULTISPECIES: autoinducer 2 ABC transporter substrate-binding protein [unclassified Shewanella]MEC4725566.1 autoinducer 2 ABC transporter substrate-binding protein [Shewanella sp. D64]MEC4739618.1 autoinducer 2 ABC transporter substrate-binding protein [Shewanella sp. E94]WBJ94915.1 autoinducer 2 ABC transporter substrate-binding protein [Shewanella sp. MTB7]
MKKVFFKVAAVSLALLSAGVCAKDYEIVNVVKVSGIPWFNQMNKGVEQAAADLGVNARQVGPATPDPAQQVKMIEDLIAKGVDAITVVPNDVTVLEPVFKKARDKGIIVLTHESPDKHNADWNIEMLDNLAYAKSTMDEMAKHMDSKGGYVVFVGSLTVPLHNNWANLAIDYQKKTYPEMFEVTSRMPVAESVDASYGATNDLMKAYPDMKGIISYGSLGLIGAGEAIKKKRAKDKIDTVGILMPSQAAQYLMRGEIDKGFLWNPADAGYAMVAVAKMMLDGKAIEEGVEVNKLGKAEINIETRVIKFNRILEVDKSNARSLDF